MLVKPMIRSDYRLELQLVYTVGDFHFSSLSLLVSNLYRNFLHH
jgi:hypothetical protein